MLYSYLTALKIDPPLATAVLSVGMGYYESVQSTNNIWILVFYHELRKAAQYIVSLVIKKTLMVIWQ